jgi:hypothetical protein
VIHTDFSFDNDIYYLKFYIQTINIIF